MDYGANAEQQWRIGETQVGFTEKFMYFRNNKYNCDTLGGPDKDSAQSLANPAASQSFLYWGGTACKS